VVSVTTATSGRLVDVLVAPGATVRAGQTLARLDPLAARAGVARAEARLVAAEAAAFESEVGFSRLERTVEGRGGTMPDLADEDETQDVMAIAQARLAKALSEVKAREADYRLAVQQGRQIIVRAPASGIILESAADPGQAVSSGGTLFRIAVTSSRPRLVVNVPEAQMKQLQVGSPASFELIAVPGRTYMAQVREIGRLHGPDEGRQVPVVLDLATGADDPEMGMTARVIITLGQQGSSWRVPLAALSFAPPGDAASLDQPAVYLAPSESQAAFVRVSVEVGASDGAFAEVRAPELREGAAVIVGLGRRVGSR
jgi:RND family efflux transporter MFP subunit